jgi:hypothetical protein
MSPLCLERSAIDASRGLPQPCRHFIFGSLPHESLQSDPHHGMAVSRHADRAWTVQVKGYWRGGNWVTL